MSARDARMCTYMYTYVYVVLSDGTRGCCGLIYRLSLPWKPRRDRLARHPHIRVDSGLLYSPPRLPRFCSRSLSSTPALYASLYLSFVLALLRPRLPIPSSPTGFPLSSSIRQTLSPLVSSSLCLTRYTRSMSPFITSRTRSLFLSVYSPYVLLASPNESSSSRFFRSFILL